MSRKGKRAKLRFRRPSWEEKQGGRHLLIWAELARWMVVDTELRALLGLFNGARPLDKVLRLHARQQDRPLAEVEAEARDLVAGLKQKELLGVRLSTRAPPAEQVRVANLTVNLTNRCNLRCTFCYNERASGPEMPAQQFMDAIERARGVLSPDATFIILGGEPTLDRDRLFHFLDRAAGIFKPPPMVSTNGTLLDEDLVASLARRRLEVQVSLDSATAQGHDAVRGEGSYDKAIQGVKRLVEQDVPTILSMVFTRASARDFEAYMDLAHDLGAKEARFIPMRLIGRGLDQGQDLPDLAESFEILLDVLERRPELQALLVRDYFSILGTVCSHASPRPGCGIGAQVLFIDADGTVYPCPNHRIDELALGNLAGSDLERLVRGSNILEQLRQGYRVENYDGCSECPFRYWCAGDCRGETLSATGDPLAPSPHCEELKLLIPRLLWLMADGEWGLGGNLRADEIHVG